MKTEDIIKLIKEDNLIKFYSTYAWQKLRREARIRDNNECQPCKRKGKVTTKKLLVHHKKEVRDFPQLALDIDNLETCCFKCHENIHDKFAEINNNVQPKIFLEERW